MCGRRRRSTHRSFISPTRRLRFAQDAEADVRPVAGERERPGVARQQIGLEPHVEPVGGGTGDVAHVLAEGVPFAEVAGLVDAERLADRAPHPVGGDDVARPNGAEPVDLDIDRRSRSSRRRVARRHARERAPVVDVDAGRPGEAHERVVELATRRDGGELPVGRQRQLDLAARRRAQPRGRHVVPARHGRRIESEVLELAECERREPVTTALVAWEHRLVDDDDVGTATTQLDRRRGAGWSGADDEHVARERGRRHGSASSSVASPAVLRSGGHWHRGYDRPIGDARAWRLGARGSPSAHRRLTFGGRGCRPYDAPGTERAEPHQRRGAPGAAGGTG